MGRVWLARDELLDRVVAVKEVWHREGPSAGDVAALRGRPRRISSAAATPIQGRFPSDVVYGPTDHAALRLITFGGEFDQARRSYRDNVVVCATLAHEQCKVGPRPWTWSGFAGDRRVHRGLCRGCAQLRRVVRSPLGDRDDAGWEQF